MYPFILRNTVDVLDSVLLDGVVSALRDDPRELGERASVQLNPVHFLVRVSAPRSSVHVVLVSGRLQTQTQ